MASKNSNVDIVYTIVDEAPELASASLLPIIKKFCSLAGISVGTMDISLAGRIIAAFPEGSDDTDDLAALDRIVKTREANVIKLPNISASVPQLVAAIKELQAQGRSIPDYPEEPKDEIQKEIRKKYDAIKGSAVNPVLREGNSDRRAAKAVKQYAKNNPHSMGEWSASSKTHVSSMSGSDFYANEKSRTISADEVGAASIEFVSDDGGTFPLKKNIDLQEGAVVDASFLSVKSLREFLKQQIEDAKKENILFSVHLKATMMKVSDPIIFGHVVSVFFDEVFSKHSEILDLVGADPNAGLGDILSRLKDHQEVLDDVAGAMINGPKLYMVDSNRGITNLHVPSDVIIDASMPAVIRAGGIGWGPDGDEQDVKCVIPDNCYAPIYDETIKFFKENGALDPRTAGAVANVGLMAQKAEEYGSHPTTFEAKSNGRIRYVSQNGVVLFEHRVEKGDIWRSSMTKKAPIEDWINLGIERQALTGSEAIFWLDANRAHDAELIRTVERVLEQKKLSDKFKILSPRQATRATLETITKGADSIAITGNVLRDYLTDLFPILELGTSAKMLSIVKLMQGGGLFETGAGGSAPKHVQQFTKENHLRWDSLGEFCALGESLNFLANQNGNMKAAVLGEAVEQATQAILDFDRSPSRKVGEADNRESHFYFAQYWAKALAEQTKDVELAKSFQAIASALLENEEKIVGDLRKCQGSEVDIGGYYRPNAEKVSGAMRPSATFNAIID
ncbi:MAG: NADP-dependent isocitrate dehydrogenase [Burkholderiales bacterium]